MRVHLYRDEIAPREWRWHATNQEYDLDVPVGSGATPLKAITDLCWHLDLDIEPAQCSIIWEN